MTRRNRNKLSTIDSALEDLRSKKNTGQTRLDDFEDSDDEIYDYLDEQEYSKYIADNRKKAKGFVISDGVVDSREYIDDGEELWVQEHERYEKENIPKKSNKTSQKQQTRISSLLLKGSTAPKEKKQDNIRKTVMSTDTLDSYLDDFDMNPFDNTDNKNSININTNTFKSSDNIQNDIQSIPLTSISKQSNNTNTFSKNENNIPKDIQDNNNDNNDKNYDNNNIKTQDDIIMDDVESSLNNSSNSSTSPILSFTEKIKPGISKIENNDISNNNNKQTNKLLNNNNTTKKESIKPIEKINQSDWFTICDDKDDNISIINDNMDMDNDNITDIKEDNENSKHMYLLDACYEQSIPGTVVLFGKYLNPDNGNKGESCCVRVENLYRTLYFLPRQFRATKQIIPGIEDEDGNKQKDTEEWIEDNNKPITLRNVCEEFNNIRKTFGITEFRAKPVKRQYCFTLNNIPRGEHEYIKIQFKETISTKRLNDFNIQGETYSHVFGLNQSLLERVILKQKLMGPQWIKVSNLKNCEQKSSWCKHEWSIDDISNIIPISNYDFKVSPPNLKVLSLKVNTILNHKKQANEIVIISAMIHESVKMDSPTENWNKSLSSFTAIRKLEGIPWPLGFNQRIKQQCNSKREIHLCESELTLLNCLMNFISSVDPDVIVGHNYIGFSLDVLLHRMKANNIVNWSKLGRLKRRHMPRLQSGAGGQRDSTWEEKKISAGRLICDTYLASKDLAMIRQSSYSLESLAKQQLNMIRYELNHENLHEYFRNGFSNIPPGLQLAQNKIQYLDDRNLDFLIKHTENDSYIQLSLMFKFQIIPLTKQLTNLSGNLWSRSLTGSRAERIAFYLLHEFHNRKYITPDKISYKENTSRKKKLSYTGGLVLQPKRGFYDQFILLLDFNSLYPSLIQEYNICFTTLNPNIKYDSDGNFIPIDDNEYPLNNNNKKNKRGILPQVLKTLIDRRKGVKQMIKNEKDSIKLQQLDIKQKALKLTANSMYGCLGFPQSRFYAMPLAELITRKGREALRLSKSIAEDKLGFDVIYGDTDSIMVYTGTTDIDKAKEMASTIKKTINQKYTQLELDLDGIFKTMLLLKKKKYAALMLSSDGKSTIKETKGLDLVRRDWCPLSKQVGQKVLDFILSGNPIDDVLISIHQYLREIGTNIYNKPLEDFVITKSLSKEPEQYSKSTPLPHVTVALSLIQQGKSVRVGNHIPYVICNSLDDDIVCSYAQRAYHPENIQKAGGILEIDYSWYLENQILAPILRLIDPIEGTDPKRIAECLGITDSKLANKFSSNYNGRNNDDKFFKPLTLDDIERFKDAEPFIIECNYCKTKFPFQSIASINNNDKDDNDNMNIIIGHTCTNDDCQMELDFSTICNQLNLFIRKHIQTYYAGWLSCDDPSCCNRTRTIFLKSSKLKCTILRCGGKMYQEYSSSRLYNQLGYLQNKFDINKFKTQSSKELIICAEAYLPFYNGLHKIVQTYLKLNAHNFVDCKQLFSCFSELSIK